MEDDYDEFEAMYDEGNLGSPNSKHPRISKESSATVPSKRYRGEAKGLREKKEPKFLEWDRLNRPFGEWKKSFASAVGKKVHANLNINIRYWSQVPTPVKEKLWDELRRMFNIEDTKKKVVLKKVQTQFKDWKAKLVSGYITFTRAMPKNPKLPYELYSAVTKDQWEQFVADRSSNVFKEISAKARASQAHNKHPHYMGAKSYAQKEIEWRTEGRYPLTTDESDTATQISIDDRSWGWILGRQRKNDKGEWEFPMEETQKVVERIEKVREEVSEGKFIPNRQDDILSRGLGRIEHRGRVSGIGGTIGHRDYFGKPENKRSSSSFIYSDFESISQNMEQKFEERLYEKLENKWRAKVRAETIVEMKEVMKAEVQQQVQDILKSLDVKLPSKTEGEMDSVSKGDSSSCHSINPIDPFADLLEPTPCQLTLPFESNKEREVVAIGLVIPTSSTVTHGIPHNPDHVRVSVDKVFPEHKMTTLPVPSSEFCVLGKAEGSFVRWPKSLVIIQPKGTTLKQKKIKNNDKDLINKEKVAEKSHQTLELASTIPFCVYESGLHGLSDTCIKLKNSFSQDTLLEIQLNKEVFGYDKNQTTYISTKDVMDLLSDDCLNISVLSVWIMFLNKRCIEKNVKTIAFLCPEAISATNISSSIENMHLMEDYMKDVMKASQGCKRFILAPYFQDYHWMLLAICPTISRVYVFDPMRQRRKLIIRNSLIQSFSLYKIYGGTNSGSKLNWSAMTCAQQPGGKECGYYIMRYMLEIVDNYNSCESLFQEYRKTEQFNEDEIGEVKDLWASYIMDSVI